MNRLRSFVAGLLAFVIAVAAPVQSVQSFGLGHLGARGGFGAGGGAGGGAAVNTFRQISGMVQYATQPVANGSSFTQVQSRKAFFVHKNGTNLKITIGNVLSAAAGDTALPDATWRVGLYDPLAAVYYPVNFAGSASILLTSGQIATSDEVAIPVTGGAAYPGGKLLYVIKYVTYATAPANFPASRYVATGGDLNEWGNSLTDKTRSGAWTFSRPAGSFDLAPVLAISVRRAASPVVAILGDSISSDFSGDTLNDYVTGYTANAFALAGIPTVNVGVSSLSLTTFMGAGYAAKRARIYSVMVAAGVTHCYCPLGTNDWPALQTAAQLYANYLLLKAELDAFGIKLIPATLQPRTNATNNGQNGSETNTFTERATFNANIIASNGVGYGYYDLAAVLQDSVTPNFWRTDLRKVTAVAINAGGANYAAVDLLNLPSAIRIQATTVSAGSVATATLRRGGAFLVDPTNPVASIDGLSNAASSQWSTGGLTAGSGANFTLTTAAAGFDSTDGVHPGPTYHAYAQQDLASKAPIIFN